MNEGVCPPIQDTETNKPIMRKECKTPINVEGERGKNPRVKKKLLSMNLII